MTRTLSSLLALGALVFAVAFLPADRAVQQRRTAEREELGALSALALNDSLHYLHLEWWNAQGYSMQTTDAPSATGTATSPASPRTALTVSQPASGFAGGETPIRGQAMAAYATAIALKEGVYDPARVTVSQAEAKRRVVAWTNSLALSYRRDAWGGGWESALWVYYFAFGAKQVWTDLPPASQQLVREDVVAEADSLLTRRPLYLLGASGTALHPGDTKAEENAWNGNLLLFAAREFADNPHAAAWEAHARRYMICAWAMPAQTRSDSRIEGSNLNADGTITNHSRGISPDYMLTIGEFTAKSALIARDTRTSVPWESAHNFPWVWWALTVAKYPSPPYLFPGGTIYRRGMNRSATAQLYYPSGGAWAIRRHYNAALMDIEALNAEIDPKAFAWATEHLQAVRQQQSRHPDGRIFSPGETLYPLDEQLAAASEAEMCVRLGAAGE